MGPGGISIWQLLILLLIILLLFGTKRLRNLGSDLGSALKGFRKSMSDDDSEPKLGKAEARAALGDSHVAGQRQLEAAAETDTVHHRDRGQRQHVEAIHDGVDAIDEGAQPRLVLIGRL